MVLARASNDRDHFGRSLADLACSEVLARTAHDPVSCQWAGARHARFSLDSDRVSSGRPGHGGSIVSVYVLPVQVRRNHPGYSMAVRYGCRRRREMAATLRLAGLASAGKKILLMTVRDPCLISIRPHLQ